MTTTTTRMVVVVGSGIAGTAAALAARTAGADVLLVRGAAGATLLAPGAIDLESWEEASARAETSVVVPLEPEVAAVIDALGLHAVKTAPAFVATVAGVVRAARAVDRSLLDLASVPGGGTIFLPEIDREGWDAPLLARALRESRFAKDRGLAFESVPSQLLVATSERSLPDGDMAARADDPARLAQLAERLRAAIAGKKKPAAILLPPWLGVDAPRAEALSKEVGVPCGELAVALSSPAGLRFARARDRALEKAGIATRSGWVTSIERQDDACILHIPDHEPVRASAVVVATGGVAAGGIAYVPGESSLATALPRAPRAVFTTSIKTSGSLGFEGKPIGIPGSLFGMAPEALAWPFRDPPPLDRVGLLVGTDGAAAPGIFAAGDAVADEPRTFLGALRSGVRAGKSAASLSPSV